MLVKLDGKDSPTVVNELTKNASQIASELYKSLTWGKGTEKCMAQRFHDGHRHSGLLL